MTDTFQRDGVRFSYPPDWQLEAESEGDDGWTASLQGPGTAFLVVSYCAGIDNPDEVVEAALEGLRADYPDLEAEDAVDTIGGQPAVGADVNFSHLDLTNTCWIRALNVPDGALLVMAQCTDEELEEQAGVLKAIVGSIVVEE